MSEMMLGDAENTRDTRSSADTSTSNADAHAQKFLVQLREMTAASQAELDEKLAWKQRLRDFPARMPDLDAARLQVDEAAARERALAAVQPEIDLVSTVSREQFEAQLQRTAAARTLERSLAAETERTRRAEAALAEFHAEMRQILDDLRAHGERAGFRLPDAAVGDAQ
ncbi:hypothetical protein M3Y99_00540400 [Aphelenchoides fujianensis]|nr:hypothetical protein M3Y99_00540400 [Aphelenchoides fujianensis]